MVSYKHPIFKELERQLLVSPERVRRTYADRLEEFLLSLDPETVYPYEFLAFRITGFRPRSAPLEALHGREMAGDLVLILDRLSEREPKPSCEVPERVLTLEEVRAIYMVTTRTLHRWRRRGLVCRRYVFPDSKLRTGVRESALERFVEANPALVSRAGKFSRISPAERQSIRRQARVLAAQGELSLSAIAARIAKQAGRSKEAVRQLLKSREPESAPGAAARPAKLKADEKRRVYATYRAGHSMGAICKEFGRSRQSIYRILNEARARQILGDDSIPGPVIPDPAFFQPAADEKMLGQDAALTRALSQRPQAGRPAERHRAGAALSEEVEENLFRRCHYLRHKAGQLKAQLNPKRYVHAGLLDEIDRLMAEALSIKKVLFRSNLRFVGGVARKHAGKLASLPDLLSEGVLCLMRAIDSFDYTRGGRLGPYATWALMMAFARTLPEDHFEDALPEPTAAGAEQQAPAVVHELRRRLRQSLPALSQHEQELLRSSFALDEEETPERLSETARSLGLSA